MKKGRAILLILLFLFIGGGLAFMLFTGMFSRKYAVGEDITRANIKKLVITSNGMLSEDCWKDEIVIDGDTATVLLTAVGADEIQEELTKSQWRAIYRHLEGHVCKKKTKNPFQGQVLDGDDANVMISWDSMPEGTYCADLTAAEITDLHNTIARMLNHPEEYDPENIVEVSFSKSGDAIGSRDEIRLYKKKGVWTIETLTLEGNGAKEIVKEYPVTDRVISTVREILADYEWLAMKDLPGSEIFASDEATTTLSITFEPFQSWELSTTKAFTPDASECWKRLKTCLREAVPN